MLRCKEVAQLASERLDRSLSLTEWFSLRLHLLLCAMCTRYVDQLKFLQRACDAADQEQTGEAGLADEARERIRRRLDQNH